MSSSFNPIGKDPTNVRIFTHLQTDPAKEWNIKHQLKGVVSIIVFENQNDALKELESGVDYTVAYNSNTNAIVSFIDQQQRVGTAQCIKKNDSIQPITSTDKLMSIGTNKISFATKHKANYAFLECNIQTTQTLQSQQVIAVYDGEAIINSNKWYLYTLTTDNISNNKKYTITINQVAFSNILSNTSLSYIPFNYFCLVFDVNNNVDVFSYTKNKLFDVNSNIISIYSSTIITTKIPIKLI